MSRRVWGGYGLRLTHLVEQPLRLPETASLGYPHAAG